MEEENVCDVMLYLAQHCNINQANFDHLMEQVDDKDRIIHLMRKKMKQNKMSLPSRLQVAGLNSHRLQEPSPEGLLEQILAGHEGTTQRYLRVSPAALKLMVRTMEEERPGAGTKIECIIFLYWLANGFNYKEIEENFNMIRRNLYKATKNVLTDYRAVVRKFVSRAPEIDEMGQIGAKFAELTGSQVFKHCTGVLTGIKVKGYKDNNPNYEIRVQILIDSNGDMRNLYIEPIEYSVLQCSLITQKPYLPNGYFMLADEEYPCMTQPKTIISPYIDPGTQRQRTFNEYCWKAQKLGDDIMNSIVARYPMVFNKGRNQEPERLIQTLGITVAMQMICKKVGDLQYMDADKRGPDYCTYGLGESSPQGREMRDKLASKLYLETLH